MQLNTNLNAIYRASIFEVIELVRRKWEFNIRILELRIVDNKQMKELNRYYLDHDYETDVLSFNTSDDDYVDGFLIINYEFAHSFVSQNNVLGLEILRYFVHGILHLVGFNDATKQDRWIMACWENDLLNCLSFVSRETWNKNKLLFHVEL